MKKINLTIAFVFISISSIAQQYTYDKLNRMTSITYPSGQVVLYEYDELGNRKTKTKNEITAITESLIENEKIQVYPNPASTKITVKLLQTNVEISKIEMVNLSGTIVWDSGSTTLTNPITIPLNFASGTYILNILGKGGDEDIIGQEKIIIMR